MTWSAPRTWSNSALVTGVQLNASIRDDFAQQGPNVVTSSGDMFYASAPNTLARLPIGSAKQLLSSNGTIPSFGDFGQLLLSSGGGRLVQATAINATPQTLIASGITVAAHILGITIPNSGSNFFVNVHPLNAGASAECYTGGADSLTASVSAGGALSIVRSAGTKTYSVAFWVVYY